MSDFILNILDKVQQYSHSIQKQSMYTNKPWVLIDNDLEVQKMIFKNNNELILSKNGKVQVGYWELLVGTKSILIDRGSDKLLLNEVFLNDDLMILKLDGTKLNFFVFANENTVSDLDVKAYFERLIFKQLNSIKIILSDKRVLKMYYSDSDDYFYKEKQVRIDNQEVVNGIYFTTDRMVFFINNSRISKVYYLENYTINEGILQVYSISKGAIETGEMVYLNKILIQGDKIIDFSTLKRLIIKDGKVEKLEWKNPILRRLFN